MLWKLASCGNYGNFNLSPYDSNPMISDEGGLFIHLNPPTKILIRWSQMKHNPPSAEAIGLESYGLDWSFHSFHKKLVSIAYAPVNKTGKTWEKAKLRNVCGETVSLAAGSSSRGLPRQLNHNVVCHWLSYPLRMPLLIANYSTGCPCPS
jgi:hypothetical protein